MAMIEVVLTISNSGFVSLYVACRRLDCSTSRRIPAVAAAHG
jgi:hypothetical protein